MKIIKASAEIIDSFDGSEVIKKLEQCGRVCYKSEGKITGDSGEEFIRSIIARGHESVIEHFSFSAKFICDRGVSHEIVRHRLASYSQESTRYCNYAQDRFNSEITVIEPCFLKPGTKGYELWRASCEQAEKTYFDMLNWGCTPQEARAVLPNSLKTEIIMTSNIREWRHFFRLRTSPAAHPQMREVAGMLHKQAKKKIPVVFGDIKEEGL